jgi:hypothetical protein
LPQLLAAPKLSNLDLVRLRSQDEVGRWLAGERDALGP